MTRLSVTIIVFFSCLPVYPQQELNSYLENLDEVIGKRQYYFEQKQLRIDSIKHEIFQSERFYNPDFQFESLLVLFNEYSTYIYDSAFSYAFKLHEKSTELNDPSKIDIARIKLSFTFLSGGMFKEALDTLLVVSPQLLEQEDQYDYYYLLARIYLELSDYTNDGYYAPQYINLGIQAVENAMAAAKINSPEYFSMQGLLYLHHQNALEAINTYEELLSKFESEIGLHQFAIEATSLSYVYGLNGQMEKSDIMLARAAMADIKTATKETVALRILAEHLYKRGMVKRAYNYINISLEEATLYEANHRKIQISNILPIIEKEQLNIVERQKKKLMKFIIGISILSFLVIVLTIVVLAQVQKIKIGRGKIELANHDLKEINTRLREANKIKEEYIGYFFKGLSDNIEKVEKLKRAINRLLTTKNYEEIKETIKNLDLKKEREKLFIDFDRSFLSIFPTFIDQLNQFFEDKDRITLGKDQILPPEVRIIALIRLGISDSEKIAQVLNYSLNTIYTYKTKIKNKALISNDEFEDRIMKIRVVK